MKRTFLLLLSVLLLLSCAACSAPADVPQTVAVAQSDSAAAAPEASPDSGSDLPDAVPAEPATARSVVKASNAPVLAQLFSRGDTVVVLGTDEEYYILAMEDGAEAMMERCLVRLETEEPFSPWVGYAASGACAYSNWQLEGEPLPLAINTVISVIDKLGDVYLIEGDGKPQYIAVSAVSQNPISNSNNAPANRDGGDIQVTAGLSLDQIPQAVFLANEQATYPLQGTVLADCAEAILAFHARGDEERVLLDAEAPVLENGFYSVLLDGRICLMAEKYLRLDMEAPYSERIGYARSGAAVFSEVQQRHTALRVLSTNSEVKIIEEAGDMLVVEIDGLVGYVSADMITETPIPPSAASGGGGADWSPPLL